MKKLLYLLILIPLCFALSSDAKMNFYQAASVQGGAACSKGATILAETFEDMIDGEEWDDDGNWSEPSAQTDVWIADTDTGPPNRIHGGSVSGMVDNTANGYTIQDSFTEITSGYTTFEFYCMWNAVNVTISDTFAVLDGTSMRSELYISSAGYLQFNSNTTLTNIVTVSADTYYKIEVQINTSQADGIGAVYVWVNDTQYGPYDTTSRANPAGIDTQRFYSDSSTDAEYWIDDYLHYAGARCAS